MSRTTTSSAQNWSNLAPPSIAPPFSYWCNKKATAVGNGQQLMSIDSNTLDNQAFTLEVSTAVTLGAYSWAASPSAQHAQGTQVVLAAGAWFGGGGAWGPNYTGQTVCEPNGNLVTNNQFLQPSVTPTGMHVNGMGNRSMPGEHGYHGIILRVLDPLEWAYLVARGNMRALGFDHIWGMNSGTGVEPDLIGGATYNLTDHGSTAGTDDPNQETFLLTPIGSKVYAVGVPIPALNLSSYFENVNSPFNCSLQQLSTGTAATTTSAASPTGGASSRVVPATSAAPFSVGDYLSIGANPTTRVIAVNAGTGRVLMAKPQTWANGTTIFRYSVAPLTVPGLSISANTLLGTGTGGGAVYPRVIVRSTCAANGAISADSDILTITMGSTGAAFQPRHRRNGRVNFYNFASR